MTDQQAFELAGWIERARKAEAALTANGFEQHYTDGTWIKPLPEPEAGGVTAGAIPFGSPEHVKATQDAALKREDDAIVDALWKANLKREQDKFQQQFERDVRYTARGGAPLPPIDYDTKS